MKVRNKFKGWLLIFYTVPSMPVNNRIRLWRRLARVGAVPLKGSVYILPHTEENYEFCQWLVSEVSSVGGEGSFVKVKRVETLEDRVVIDLFNKQREKEYREIEKGLESIERRVNSIKKGSRIEDYKRISDLMNKYLREFEEVRKVDFFSSRFGYALEKKIRNLTSEFKGLAGEEVKKQSVSIVPRHKEDYQGKTWVTRKRPFVDRMASAWLIKRFIDRQASFKFIDENDLKTLKGGVVTFDIKNGDFTHQGNMCTFEVLMKSFNLRDKSIKKIAEIVHELDIKDDKYRNIETKGIEKILLGIRKIAEDDIHTLEKGISIFDMLYESST
ncbi:MAG TPA: hypothetical protein DEP99_03665 [Nitrospiraceae bacterium]|nr:hypothetical protein [Nitrospiraceae bacterium]